MISASRDRVSVVFDFAVGDNRYRIVRIMQRSGSHRVQLEKHDGKDFSINLADQARNVDEKVLEILGLDAAAFKQAVILPQGEFANFLKAEPRERREILRSLLRLEVYEQMRSRANGIASNKRNKVESTRKVLTDEYKDVSQTVLASLESQNKEVSTELEGKRAKRDEARRSLLELRRQHEKTSELSRCEGCYTELQSQAENIESMKTRLDEAERAAPARAPGQSSTGRQNTKLAGYTGWSRQTRETSPVFSRVC